MTAAVKLDGHSLTIEQLAQIARIPSIRVTCDPATYALVAKSEALIQEIVTNYRKAFSSGETPPTEYGVTTGFGEFKDKRIAPDDLEQLQRNVRSEEHTSELQSHLNLVCRLLLEKKKKTRHHN